MKSCPWEILAMEQPHSGQVKNIILSLDGFVENVDIADITTQGVNPAPGISQAVSDVFKLSPGEVIVNFQFGKVMFKKFLNYITSDKTCTSDYQYFGSVNFHFDQIYMVIFVKTDICENLFQALITLNMEYFSLVPGPCF